MDEQVPPELIAQFESVERALRSDSPRRAGSELGRAVPLLVKFGLSQIRKRRNRALVYDLRRDILTRLRCMEVYIVIHAAGQLSNTDATVEEIAALMEWRVSPRRIRALINGPLYVFTVEMEPDRDGDQRRVGYRACANPAENPNLDPEEREFIGGAMEALAPGNLESMLEGDMLSMFIEAAIDPGLFGEMRRTGLRLTRLPARLQAMYGLTEQGEEWVANAADSIRSLREFLWRHDELMLAGLAKGLLQPRE